MSSMCPMKVEDIDDNTVLIKRPDILGLKMEGIAPYGAYGKFIVDKRENIIKVWALDVSKDDPDYIIVNGLSFYDL